jgi:7,8-dihydropterin-6-yl-methyl-4-(beta-D-ribofuranosyl)aminobenzene 5'-phosphate synthase
MAGFTLTLLLDNRCARAGLASEWGLAWSLETDQGTWLWDAGASRAFLDNARALGLEPAAALGLLLSHGHYDHTGGIAALAAAGYSNPVLAHPEVTTRRWSLKPGSEPRYIGMEPDQLDVLQGLMEPVKSHAEPVPGLHFLTSIPRASGRFQAVEGFYADTHGREPDPVPDDAFLALDTEAGWVVVLGCCHAGLANSLDWLAKQLGVTRVACVAGGLHLHRAGPKALEETAEVLEAFGVDFVFPCHCTGEAAAAWLGDRLPGRVRPAGSGLVLDAATSTLTVRGC